MTRVASIYLGNIHQNPNLKEIIAQQTCLTVSLSEKDRSKGRIHAHTDSGIAIGIIKSRDRPLASGDLFKTDSDQLVLIQLQTAELLVIDLANLGDCDPTQLIKLGHVLGNHHYPLAIQKNKIYVKLITPKPVVEKLIKDLFVEDLQINYETVSWQNKLNFAASNH
ncbi:MAG: urease accessory protein UreE [Cyanobacteria bacterium J06621_8]